jgi:hypothetical protein
VTLLDAYGLSRDDMMETMREMQFTIEKDTSMCDYFDKLDSQVKVRTHINSPALIRNMKFNIDVNIK